MKKILFPAIAALMIAGAPAAFAEGGPWYVVLDKQSNSCNAEHSVGTGAEQSTLSGPLPSQIAALDAIHSIPSCGGIGGYGDTLGGYGRM
jgi:hypothetical protein